MHQIAPTKFVYRPDPAAMLATMKRNDEERPAREAALLKMLREFACDYGTAAIKPLLDEATGRRVHL